MGHEGRPPLNSWAEWFDLDRQLEHMDGLRHEVSVICAWPFLDLFLRSAIERRRRRGHDVERRNGRRAAQISKPGLGQRCGSLTDTETAIKVLDYGVVRLGLMGVDIPGSIGRDTRIDTERLARFTLASNNWAYP